MWEQKRYYGIFEILKRAYLSHCKIYSYLLYDMLYFGIGERPSHAIGRTSLILLYIYLEDSVFGINLDMIIFAVKPEPATQGMENNL